MSVEGGLRQTSVPGAAAIEKVLLDMIVVVCGMLWYLTGDAIEGELDRAKNTTITSGSNKYL